MGITRLLPLLQYVSKRADLSRLANKRVGVDTFCWLHKAINVVNLASTTRVLPVARWISNFPICGLIVRRYAHYIGERVALLRSFNITPVLIFDGGPLPLKESKHSQRSSYVFILLVLY